MKTNVKLKVLRIIFKISIVQVLIFDSYVLFTDIRKHYYGSAVFISLCLVWFLRMFCKEFSIRISKYKESGLYTKPILAWRVWGIKEPYLRSLVRDDTVWYPDEPLIAAHCYLHKGKDSPTKDCSCGIYCKNSMSYSFIKYLNSWQKRSNVLGLVYVWGKVIEHEDGYRAECAYPAKLFITSPKQDAARIINLANKYNIPWVILNRKQRIKLFLGGTSWISENHKKNLELNLLSRLFPQEQSRNLSQ